MQIHLGADEGIALTTKTSSPECCDPEKLQEYCNGGALDVPERRDFRSLSKATNMMCLIHNEKLEPPCDLSDKECFCFKCNNDASNVLCFTGEDAFYEQLKWGGDQCGYLAVQNFTDESSVSAVAGDSLVVRLQNEGSLSETAGSSTADLMDVVSDAAELALDERYVLPTRLPGRKRFTSKNITSERRRRQKLNDSLYALRAIVPNITKMDKASIVSDAIEYLCDLQKQVEGIELDISNLKGEAESVNRAQGPDAPSASKGSSITSDTSSNDGFITEESDGKKSVQLEVSKIEEYVYHLYFSFGKLKGGLLDLLQGLSSLDVDILNASLVCHQNEFHNIIIAKMQAGWEHLSISEVEMLIKNMILKYCRRCNDVCDQFLRN